MKLKSLLVVLAVVDLLPSCGTQRIVEGLADAPTQIVMAYNAARPGALWQGISVEVFPLPPDGGQLSFNVGKSPLLSKLEAIPTIPPGITVLKTAADQLYFVTYWARDYSSRGGIRYTLVFLISDNGRYWLDADDPRYGHSYREHHIAQSPNLLARPSLSSFPKDKSNLRVAFRDPSNGKIRLFTYHLWCTGDPYPPDRCARDAEGRLLFVDVLASPRPEPDLGVSSAVSPTLSYVGDELVLAYAARDGVRILKSGDGETWTQSPGIVATLNGAPVRSVHAPYLNNTLGQLWLTTTQPRGAGLDVVLYSSADGLHWTEEQRHPTGAGFNWYPAAVAGSVSDRIVAFPGPNNMGVEIAIGPATTTRLLALGRNYGVALTKGSGPVAIERLSCAAGETLVARTPSGDVSGHLATFPTGGAFDVICHPSSSSRRVCSSNTRWASIVGTGPTYRIECWRWNLRST